MLVVAPLLSRPSDSDGCEHALLWTPKADWSLVLLLAVIIPVGAGAGAGGDDENPDGPCSELGPEADEACEDWDVGM